MAWDPRAMARLQVWREAEAAGEQRFTYIIPAQPGQAQQSYHLVRTQALLDKLTQDLLGIATRLHAWRPDGRLDPALSFEKFGAELAQQFLPGEVRDFLFKATTPLLIDTDDATFPWELLTVSGQTLGLHRPLARVTPQSYQPLRLSRSWNATRRALIIGDPLSDLPSGVSELRALTASLQSYREPYTVTPLAGNNATITQLQRELQGGYEVLHFIGHVEHDEHKQETSALVCAGGERCDARMIRSVQGDYAFVFINNCQSTQAARAISRHAYLMSAGGLRVEELAQAFLDGGARTFIGALWPVPDDGAHRFAQAFYSLITSDMSFGEALQRVRSIWRDQYPYDPTWAAYVLYGEPTLTLNSVRESPHHKASANAPSSPVQIVQAGGVDDLPVAERRQRVNQSDQRAPASANWAATAGDRGPGAAGTVEEESGHQRDAGFYSVVEQASPDKREGHLSPASAGAGGAGGHRPEQPASPHGANHAHDDRNKTNDALKRYLRSRVGEPPLAIAPMAEQALRNAARWCSHMGWPLISRFDVLLGLAQVQGGALNQALTAIHHTAADIETANVQLFKKGPGITEGMSFSHGVSELLRTTAAAARSEGRQLLTDLDLVCGLLALPLDGSIVKGFSTLPFSVEMLLAALPQPASADSPAQNAGTPDSKRGDGVAPVARVEGAPPFTNQAGAPAGAEAEAKGDASVLQVLRDLRREARQRLDAHTYPPLIGRVAELNAAVFALTDPSGGHVLLRGLPGVGKQALISGLARLLEEEPDSVGVERFAAWRMYAVRVDPTVENPGDWLAAHLHELQKAGPALIVLENFPTTVRLAGVAHVLMESIESGGTLRLLAAATFSGYEAALGAEPELVAQFVPIDLLPPTTRAQTQAMVTAYARFLERQYLVRIDATAIQRAIELAPRTPSLALPGAAIHRLENACATEVGRRTAELNASEEEPGAAGITLNNAAPITINAQAVEQALYGSDRS